MLHRKTIEPGLKVIVKLRGESLSRANNRGVITRVFSGVENPIPKVEFRSYKTGNLYVVALDNVLPDVAKHYRKKKAKFVQEESEEDDC